MRVFISYASEDHELAEQVHLALVGAGHSTFFDQESLPPSGDYHTRIREAVNQSDAFVFLINSRSVSPRRYTLTELKYARAKWPHPKDRVLPVIMEAISFEAIPPYLKAVTVLEPKGNLAAEVVDALSLMQRNIRAIEERSTVWQPANWPVKKRIIALGLFTVIMAAAFMGILKWKFPGNAGIGKWNYPSYLEPEKKQAGEFGDAGTITNVVNNRVRATVKHYPLLGKLWCGLPGNNGNPITARVTESTGAEYSVDTSRHLLLGKDGEPVSDSIGTWVRLQSRKYGERVLDGEPVLTIPKIGLGTLKTRRFLVTHCTGGNVSLIHNVSTHLVIDRNGAVKQKITFDAAAFHSGRTNWQGITYLNAHSIGIAFVNWGRLQEMEGVWYSSSGKAIPAEEVFIYNADDNTPSTAWHKYTDEQIKAFFVLTCALRRAYPGLIHLLGNDEISQGRKVDPGPAFPLNELARRLYLKGVSDPLEELVTE